MASLGLEFSIFVFYSKTFFQMFKLTIQEILTKYLQHVEERIVGNLNISKTNCSERSLQTSVCKRKIYKLL